MTDKNEMEEQRENFLYKAKLDAWGNMSTTIKMNDNLWDMFKAGFDAGLNAKKGLDKEKLIKRMKELDFNCAQGKVLKMIINGDFDEK